MAEDRNPFAGVTDFFTELARIREVGRHGYGPGTEDRERTEATAWVPATDIFARGSDLVIRVEVAGVTPQDGSFRRAVTLPIGTDDSQIGAEIRDGLVEITVRGGVTGGEPQRIALKDTSSEPSLRRVGG